MNAKTKRSRLHELLESKSSWALSRCRAIWKRVNTFLVRILCSTDFSDFIDGNFHWKLNESKMITFFFLLLILFYLLWICFYFIICNICFYIYHIFLHLLCAFYLENTQLHYVQFHMALAIKEAVIRDYALCSKEYLMGYRNWLLNYCLQHSECVIKYKII